MTNYVGFINAMLDLRNQRLKESIAEAELQQQQSEQFGKQMSQMGAGLSNLFQGMGQDRMANELMSQNSSALGGQPILRAQAVDPKMQAFADGRMNKTPGFYTGGMDELKARMAMSGLRDRQMDSRLAEQKYSDFQARDTRDYNRQLGRDIINDTFKQQDDIRADQAAIDRQQQRADDIKRAEAAAKQSTLGKDYNNFESYQASMRVHENDMADAPDKDAYMRAARSAHSLWSSAKKAGLDVGDGPPDIAPFMTPLQKKDIDEQRQNVNEARAAIAEAQRKPDSWLGQTAVSLGMQPSTAKDSEIKQAQDKFDMEEGVLDSMRKGGVPFDPNAADPNVSAAPANNDLPPVGPVGKTIRDKQTKKLYRSNGTSWEEI